ncbi:MAG: hypothetical protein ACHP8B_13975 [Terriglobales bacterium]
MKDTVERFVLPEKERRQRAGVPVDAEIWAAQVIFDANQATPRMRLNREVRLLAVAAGSTVVKDYVELYDSGCRAFSSVALVSEEANIRHISLFQLGTTFHWQMLFNFSEGGSLFEQARGQGAYDTGYHEPTPTPWEALYDDHDRVVELVLAVNSPTPHAPIETVMAVALQRSRHLIQGYVPLLHAKNLAAASALIRMQLDSAMRVNACFLVRDPLQIWEALKSDAPWSRIKTEGGDKLADAYLHEQLSTKFSWATELYKQMSGYIHLSRPHLESTVKGEDFLGMVVHQGPAGAGLTDQELANNAEQFVRVTRALLSLCEDYVRTRQAPP